jgi:hypothetical protein
MIEELTKQLEAGITSLFADDDIKVDKIEFYHLLPNNNVIARVVAESATFMVTIDTVTGEGSYAEYSAKDLASTEEAVKAVDADGLLEWAGNSDGDEIALYRKGDELTAIVLEE